jgi:hypothetical protein
MQQSNVWISHQVYILGTWRAMDKNQRFSNITPTESLLHQHGPGNSYAIAEFQNSLYLAEIAHEDSPPRDRCRISTYCFETRQWNTVYADQAIVQSPGVPSPKVASQIRVLREPDADRDALFVRFASSLGSFLLRLNEHGRFQPMSAPLEMLEPCFFCHKVLDFDNRLVGLAPDEGGYLKKIVEFSPDRRTWLSNALPGLEADTNRSLSDIVAYAGALYAATINSERGFEIWKADGGQQELAWKVIIDRGAYRFVHNQQVFSMVAHEDAFLFLIAGTPLEERTPESKFFDYHGFEVIRLDAGSHWDLMVGVPRFSPFGLLVPFSGLGPSLDPRRRREFRCCVEHAGRLIMGVHDEDGFRLWRSATGEQWELVDESDFGEIYQVDSCQMWSSGGGLTLILDITDLSGGQETQIWSGNIDQRVVAK